MRRFLPLICFVLGLLSGVAIHRSFVSFDSEIKDEVAHSSSETKQTKQTEETLRDQSRTAALPSVTVTPVPVETPPSELPVEPAKECPACPCLYSEEILPPPNFDPSVKEVIETNHEGEAYFKWSTVPGTKKYAIHIERENGTSVKMYKTSRTMIFLKDIPLPVGAREATYFLRLASINGKDIQGSLGPKRKLHVKPQSSVTAPSIEEIKVED